MAAFSPAMPWESSGMTRSWLCLSLASMSASECPSGER